MVYKTLVDHKNDKVFVIGKGLFDDTAASEYMDAVAFLRGLGFSSITTALQYQGVIDQTDQTDWMKWCGRELLSSDILFIIPTDREVRLGPLDLYHGYEWCRELAHSVKIPVYYEEYEKNV